ncbi:sulfite exporter TauE/SafE family protein [Actinomyces procaprae]|uniref:sulfite exporter TauE/SafE family protein n=1 Tax=Actinomyces procaprae TaxID=2560010 RepID=UPI00109DCD65|nr:sulfite exporter TauE/SafE family protein [Actinomyces procaprae]
MTEALYAVVVLAATTAGAVAGLGGGVIIKPLLDLMGVHGAASIGVYSAVAVFAMCLVSIAAQLRAGFRFETRLVISVSAGSMAGGWIGERLFNLAAASLGEGRIKAVQAGLLGITLLGILAYTLAAQRLPHWRLRNTAAVAAVGVFLGAISVFLGIGGGPLNIALLTLLFSFEMKEATVYSLATIFFSQITKLAAVAISGVPADFTFRALPVVVAAAVVGGLVGTRINRRCSNAAVRRFYIVLMVALLAVSARNLAAGLTA